MPTTSRHLLCAKKTAIWWEEVNVERKKNKKNKLYWPPLSINIYRINTVYLCSCECIFCICVCVCGYIMYLCICMCMYVYASVCVCLFIALRVAFERFVLGSSLSPKSLGQHVPHPWTHVTGFSFPFPSTKRTTSRRRPSLNVTLPPSNTRLRYT